MKVFFLRADSLSVAMSLLPGGAGFVVLAYNTCVGYPTPNRSKYPARERYFWLFATSTFLGLFRN